MMLFGPFTWLILLVLLATFVIQGWLQRTYARFSRVPNAKGLTGAETARLILDRYGLTQVRVEPVRGQLTDHYDPRTKTVRLSEGNYASPSLAALAVAAHEVGHALQDADDYVPMRVRAQLVPAAQIGSNLGPWLFIIGLMLQMTALATLGLYLFAAAAIFQLVTLPVEFNASSRALANLRKFELLAPNELPAARKVLTAAAMTYVAALAMSVAYLIQYAAILGVGRDD
ncbi:zinc metallopeptidase [Oceanithermus sp.]|uniref:zinc metallopeptidase n=1 Tax=Oceanithermus sp. TaxID=2268145 RepID=UPI00257C033A|nr:zinc metallopeptidase [Oceanithermus sp.]